VTDLARLSATETAFANRERRVSATEVMEAAIKWIEAADPKLNASAGRTPPSVRPNAFANTLPYIFEGTITRDVEDAIVSLGVLQGAHSGDPNCHQMVNDFADAGLRDIKGMKTGFSPNLDVFQVEGKVSDVVADAVKVFVQAGAVVEEIKSSIRAPASLRAALRQDLALTLPEFPVTTRPKFLISSELSRGRVPFVHEIKSSKRRKTMKNTSKALALSAAMVVGAATASFAEERPITDVVIVEYLEFNLVEGANPDEFLRETLAMDEVLEGYVGFVARHLARNTDGSWVEVVCWTSLETAEAALCRRSADQGLPGAGQWRRAVSETLKGLRILISQEGLPGWRPFSTHTNRKNGDPFQQINRDRPMRKLTKSLALTMTMAMGAGAQAANIKDVTIDQIRNAAADACVGGKTYQVAYSHSVSEVAIVK
jgi:hypothetical protein